jgi:hypothetical protein
MNPQFRFQISFRAVPHRAQTVSQNFTAPMQRHIIALLKIFWNFLRFSAHDLPVCVVLGGKRAGAT